MEFSNFRVFRFGPLMQSPDNSSETSPSRASSMSGVGRFTTLRFSYYVLVSAAFRQSFILSD
jgi:hypothetical protein